MYHIQCGLIPILRQKGKFYFRFVFSDKQTFNSAVWPPKKHVMSVANIV